MAPETKDSFFIQHGNYISIQHIKKKEAIPFKDHVQFPILVDILTRKESHHAILCTDFQPKMRHYFLEAMLQHFTHENIPHQLRCVDLTYLDIANLTFSKAKQQTIEKDFLNLRETLETADKYVLFLLPSIDWLSIKILPSMNGFLQRQIKTLFHHPKCRFLVFTQSKEYEQYTDLDAQFIPLHLSGPDETDVMIILKQQRIELEQFHHVLIPEELLNYAYALSERFLSTNNTLENALLLLDSSAARATVIERLDTNHQFKPVLTIATMISVLSGWTNIPANCLQLHKFKFSEFVHGMQQSVFGQDTAITILAHELQQSQAHLQQTISPFCSLLFTGPDHSGKRMAAIALAEQLFMQPNVLYCTQATVPTLRSIADCKMQRYLDKRCLTLKDLIRQIPYAILLFEQIEQAPSVMIEGLQEILSTGYLSDENGDQYNFRQAIIILSTTLGSSRLIDLAKSLAPEEEHSIDLLQLVMNEQQRETFSAHHYSPQEIADEITTEISTFLPASLCQYLHVVPFLPLNMEAIEKIIRLKLKQLGKTLDKRYGIEASYAPEVVRYLADEIVKKEQMEHKAIDKDKALKQLYFVVEQAILNPSDNKNRSNQLFLQLNETGQLLHCDWLASTAMWQHAT